MIKDGETGYNKLMGENREYKSSVFSLLFSDPDVLRELYSTLEGVALPPDVPVAINTLQNVLFRNRVNDISFTVGGKLVNIYEHQSTINPNMAIRALMYISRIYEKIIGDTKGLYTTHQIRIPRPEFIVLYNGKAPFPDEKICKLSDAFEECGSLGVLEKENPALDLSVRVININQGRNEKIVQKCKVLAQYSAFIAKAREFEGMHEDREEGLKQAVIYCRDNGILKEFLEKHGTEVLNMLYAEWNQEDALAVHYAEGMEMGIEKGREEGMEEGMEKSQKEIARNALAEGASVDFVQKITGLDFETIRSLETTSD